MLLCPQVGRAANLVWAGLFCADHPSCGARPCGRWQIAQGCRHWQKAATNGHPRASKSVHVARGREEDAAGRRPGILESLEGALGSGGRVLHARPTGPQRRLPPNVPRGPGPPAQTCQCTDASHAKGVAELFAPSCWELARLQRLRGESNGGAGAPAQRLAPGTRKKLRNSK